MLIGLAEGADFDNAGPIGRKRRQLQHAWFIGSAGPPSESCVPAASGSAGRLIRVLLLYL